MTNITDGVMMLYQQVDALRCTGDGSVSRKDTRRHRNGRLRLTIRVIAVSKR